ncbi:hypothetical protein DW322_08270 [Rhodococcus rhodnii]|uniref:Uncharacterized protein n=1 Tax=Rhodococcus rhodnii TaxID=38312 RepID=A0A6P2CGX4_9NOCA|nr:hypothetical protein DW322_08270 [Rhodococcus rhodnii]
MTAQQPAPTSAATEWNPVVVSATTLSVLAAAAGAGALTFRGARAQQARIAAARAEFLGGGGGAR